MTTLSHSLEMFKSKPLYPLLGTRSSGKRLEILLSKMKRIVNYGSEES